MYKLATYTCSTTQRQLDARTCAAGWILLGEDYIMCSIFERAPVTFMPVSGKLSGVCTHGYYIILYKLLNEYYNTNSLYTMNLQILSLYVLIDPWIHCPILKSCSRAAYLMPYCLAGCGEWIWCREWILYWWLNLFEFVQSVGWKVRKYQY